MPSARTAFVSMVAAFAGCAILAIPMAAAQAETMESSAMPSRTAAILQMQFQSAATQPPRPPISGAEAAKIYQAYLGRVARGTGVGSDTATSTAQTSSAVR